MSALEILARAGAVGIRLYLDGDQLRYEAPDDAALNGGLIDDLRRNRPEIIQFLRATQSASKRPPISPSPEGPACPLSSAQQRFYFLDKLEGRSSSYNLPSAFVLEGDLDIAALQASINEIVRRHEILRTRFVSSASGLTQAVTDWSPVLRFVDLTGLPQEQRWPLFEEALRRESIEPFNVPDGPHVRTSLVRLAPDRHVFVVVMHHIVCDGGSIDPFVRDLHACYDAYCRDMAPSLESLSLQYRDFAHWQRTNLDWMAGQLEYWRETLSDAPALVQLPLDRSRPLEQTFRGDSICVALGSSLEAGVERLRATSGFTAFHILLSAFFVLLHKYSGQDDLVIGTPVSSRPHSDVEALIGPFLNMIAIRAQLPGAAPLRGVLERIRGAMIDGLDHADVPFDDVVANLQPERSSSYSPLFNVMFVLEDTPVGILNLPGLKTTTLSVKTESAKYDLTLVIQTDASGANCWFKYNSDLFDRSTMERMAAHYLNVLASVTGDADHRVDTICLLSPAEREQQVYTWNRTTKEFPLHRCTHQFFEDRAQKNPGSIALDFEDHVLTYDDANSKANQLAHFLIDRGVAPESIVAIRAERSLEMVIAVLAVLKAGAAYVPIDPEYPATRQEFMINDAAAPMLLTQRKFASAEISGAAPAVIIEDIIENPGSLPMHNPAPRAGPANPSYVIYTSGSTGTPKGVITDHRAITNNLLWMQDQWPISENDVFLLKAAFSFDVSFKEMLWPLMFGARLVIAAPGGHKDPAYLHSVIARKKVTVIHLVPTMLEYFLNEDRASGAESLRIVMCGGEALSLDLKERFCRRFNAGLLHLYGPTEAAIAVTGILFTREDGIRTIVLGRPTANCQIYLLDQGFNPVPIGGPGELFIGGVALARCYHRRPALTAEKFIPDPFNTQSGSRLYRTGDLARYLPDGNIQFLGRIDHQVKVHGLRLELDEVESVLRRHPAVADCLVTVYSDRGLKKLVAYVVFAGPVQAATAHELASFVRERLPAYMVPAAYTPLTAIPMSPNGKADRSALPEPSFAGMEKPAPEAPRTAAERLLIKLWKEVLGVETLGVNDHFFEAGGHSITLLELQKKIEEAFHRQVRITELFQHPTVDAMARLLSDETVRDTKQQERRRESLKPADDNAIAIVGLAGRFPGAQDIDQFWDMIASGREAIRFFSEEELLAEGLDPQLVRRPNFVKARGYIEGLDLFDNEFFHVTPAEASILDPQFRLLLECTQHVFDDAGYDPMRFANNTARVGVYVGASRSSYYLNQIQGRRDVLEAMGTTQVAIATDKSFAATHIAYRFDFRGPALTVDTACSSSLVAVHLACVGLLRGECDLAVSGGASIDAPFKGGYPFVEGGIGSPDGRCRPFDASARGTVKGMGGGLVLLKRLADAIRDGDHVYAVVRGTAINNDGADKVGFTAPSGDGQAEAISTALAVAGVDAGQIGFIETHGTGTSLGDPIEFAALTRVFPRGQIALGAVKANIGHLDAAAGIAGLIKTALVLRGRLIPPIAGFEKPNPEVRLERSAFYVPTGLTDWPASWGGARFAGVSSFGIGGTNAHAVLEESPPETVSPDTRDGPEIVCLSARTFEALVRNAKALSRHLSQHPEITLREVAFTLSSRREYRCRRSGVFENVPELVASLETGAFLRDPPVADGTSHRRLTFMYGPGERPLHSLDAAMLTRVVGALDENARETLNGIVQTSGLNAPQWLLDVNAVAASYAMTERLRDLGVQPDAFTGFGAGLYAARCASGGLPFEAAIRLASLHEVDNTSDVVPSELHNDVIVQLPGANPDRERAIPGIVARIWESGVNIDWERFYNGHGSGSAIGYRRVSLPGYSFERKRFWIDAAPRGQAAELVPEQPWMLVHSWNRVPLCASFPPRSRWLVFDNGSTIAAEAVAVLRQNGAVVESILDRESLPEHLPISERILDFWSASNNNFTAVADTLASARWRGRLGIIAQGVFAVTGGEATNPVLAALAAIPALLRDREIQTTIIDTDQAAMARRLVLELLAEPSIPAVAYRGSHRWLPSVQQVPLGHLAPASRMPPGKAHLIVQGLNPLGLLIAEQLAESGVDRLAIAHRGSCSTAADRLTAIRETGVDVRLISLDRESSLLEAVRCEFGKVDAVHYNLVGAPESSLNDLSPVNHATAEISELMQLSALDFGVVLCSTGDPAREPAREPALVSAVRALVAARSVSLDAPWVVATSDTWSDSHVPEASILAAAIDVLTFAMTNARIPEIHLPGASLKMIAASSADPTVDVDMSTTEQRVARVWKQIIGVPKLALDEDFFAIGGDSLMATQAAARLTSLFGVPVAPTLIYDEPTIRGLARLIDGIASMKSHAAAAGESGEREEMRV